MDPNVGTALRDARLRKKLSIEEAARAIKIRAERLTDLENNDYSRFPNTTYARGFLLLYARFLGVDLSRYKILEIGNPARGGAYQYLKNTNGFRPVKIIVPSKPVNRSRVFLVLLVFGGAAVTGILTALLILNVLRLPSLDELIEGNDPQRVASAEVQPTPETTPPPFPEPTPLLAAPETLVPEGDDLWEPESLSLTEPSEPPAQKPEEADMADAPDEEWFQESETVTEASEATAESTPEASPEPEVDMENIPRAVPVNGSTATPSRSRSGR